VDGLALPTSKSERVLAAVLLMQSATMAMDVFSALNSSPWTARSFGGDPEKNASCRRYVWHSIGFATFFALGSAYVAKSWYPIIGIVAADVYMFKLYDDALKAAEGSGSTGWS
jgi:hypothetical protein